MNNIEQQQHWNREWLKNTLRQNKKRFNIRTYIVMDSKRQSSLRSFGNEPTIEEFRAAPRSRGCIIGIGQMFNRLDSVATYLNRYGMRAAVICPEYWPEALRNYYEISERMGDHDGMVDAACYAIDHFTIKETV